MECDYPLQEEMDEDDEEISGKMENLDLSPKKEEQEIHATFDHVSFRQIHREIKYFCRDQNADELTFSPMDPQERRYLQELAHCYDLYIESHGPWEARYCALRKTKAKHIAKSLPKIDSIIESADKYINYVGSMRKGNPAKPAKSKSKSDKTSSAVSGRPLDESNTGHGLLVKMGWTPGQGLGTDNSGNVDPVEARVRRSKAGIGS